MLSDNKQAIVYAHLMDAIEAWGMLLDDLYDDLLPEEKLVVEKMGVHMGKATGILEP